MVVVIVNAVLAGLDVLEDVLPHDDLPLRARGRVPDGLVVVDQHAVEPLLGRPVVPRRFDLDQERPNDLDGCRDLIQKLRNKIG